MSISIYHSDYFTYNDVLINTSKHYTWTVDCLIHLLLFIPVIIVPGERVSLVVTEQPAPMTHRSLTDTLSPTKPMK